MRSVGPAEEAFDYADYSVDEIEAVFGLEESRAKE